MSKQLSPFETTVDAYQVCQFPSILNNSIVRQTFIYQRTWWLVVVTRVCQAMQYPAKSSDTIWRHLNNKLRRLKRRQWRLIGRRYCFKCKQLVGLFIDIIPSVGLWFDMSQRTHDVEATSSQSWHNVMSLHDIMCMLRFLMNHMRRINWIITDEAWILGDNVRRPLSCAHRS